MTDKDVLWRLGHILHEIDIVFAAAGHLSDDELSCQLALMRTGERCVEIISEATRHIPQDLRDTEPEIAWRKIVNIGNLLRHEIGRASCRERVLMPV